MAAPSHVRTDPTRSKAYQSPPRRAGSWRAERPGEVVGEAQPSGPALGNQGPDQGYVLKLANRFRDELELVAGESAADALTGASAVALRRASLYGRAPTTHDLRLALNLFGFLGAAPDEQVAWRRGHFDELHHETIHYQRARQLADLVPEQTLRMSPEAVADASAIDWRGPLGL
jgi:hypothetical protein